MQAFMSKLALTLIVCAPWAFATSQDFDIVGIRLGMSVDEVYSALKAHGVDHKNIQEHRQYYNYSDGVTNLNTDEFISYIDATKNTGSSDSLSIFFSPGPRGGRTVAVIRTVQNAANPPTRRQFLEALRKKYGAPTSEDISTVQWDFPAGKIQCLVGNVGSYQPTQPSILKKIYGANVGTRNGVLHNSKAKSLADCASYLTYAMPSGDDSPVLTARAVMVDVAATADGELSANEWVAGLAEKARKAREVKGVAPVL